MLTTHMTTTGSFLVNEDSDTKDGTTSHGNAIVGNTNDDNTGKETADTTLTSESNVLSPMVRILCSELVEHASVLQSF